eukprot:4386407-Prymnesium_polylepis.1
MAWPRLSTAFDVCHKRCNSVLSGTAICVRRRLAGYGRASVQLQVSSFSSSHLRVRLRKLHPPHCTALGTCNGLRLASHNFSLAQLATQKKI